MTERMSAAQYNKLTPKASGRRVTPETAVKDMGKAWLTLHGWDHWPNTAGMGSEPGMPDRTAIRNGRVVFIEFKAPKGKLSVNLTASYFGPVDKWWIVDEDGPRCTAFEEADDETD